MRTGKVEVEAADKSQKTYQAAHIIIATGS
jgi:pyruvate/2-oxoglutarate dehydrogenase complex dihydrolipoamide dehydrogenase (E3) component